MSLKEQAEAKAMEYQVADVCQVWNGGCPNVRKASMKMFEWTKEQFIEKACEFFAPYIADNNGGYDREYILNEFRKYMEE